MPLGQKKFLPITGAADKRTFWCGRPRFSARTSNHDFRRERPCPEGLYKKSCVDFWPLRQKNLSLPTGGGHLVDRDSFLCPKLPKHNQTLKSPDFSLTLHFLFFSLISFQARERSTDPNFGSGYLRWGEGLPRERVGAKKFGMSLASQGSQTFGRDIRDHIPGFFARVSRGCPTRLRTNKFQFWPLSRPCFFRGADFLVIFLVRFAFFSWDFMGSAERDILVCFGGSLFPKST